MTTAGAVEAFIQHRLWESVSTTEISTRRSTDTTHSQQSGRWRALYTHNGLKRRVTGILSNDGSRR
ncbi:hypothetical protein I553_1648 [Mycobacterium xenopi 4042]|uniref:Uncharacterized protein n=2 Tax=Mycobacterium xenopi TaxID=1789 RepID=A0AAD1H2N5_MYCXE|nr:hypothetical protein I552_5444 [Mycobacterium xenopi 3993]EUA54569.1 hypothetical protein I553_1648 [Mycobacterium xenopi 4042]BBU23237.1 hypothetical protein MYXE_30270 [Mycobacterium xenopi]SPX88885.1 Uncharacterised protein [Mycobacterium xenopi]